MVLRRRSLHTFVFISLSAALPKAIEAIDFRTDLR